MFEKAYEQIKKSFMIISSLPIIGSLGWTSAWGIARRRRTFHHSNNFARSATEQIFAK